MNRDDLVCHGWAIFQADFQISLDLILALGLHSLFSVTIDHVFETS